MAYPILVERFAELQALAIVCEVCHAHKQIKADELNRDAAWPCPAGVEHPETCLPATFMYDEGEKCTNCGELGYWEDALDFCCSRACKLQAEYAASLTEHAA